MNKSINSVKKEANIYPTETKFGQHLFEDPLNEIKLADGSTLLQGKQIYPSKFWQCLFDCGLVIQGT